VPFTATHPLAVVPLVYAKRLRLDTTCLVIGSMAPDFEYFARVKLVSRIGHTVPGLLLWCVPVTLLCAWVFHRVVKWPAVRLLPARSAARAAAFAERPWMPAWTVGATALLVVSALLGAITHDVWDSFTHREMWGVRHVAVLRALIPVWGIGPYPVHRVLQHGCTVVGTLVLALIVQRAMRRVQPVPIEVRHPWLGRLIWVASTAALTAAAYAKMFRHHEVDPGSMVTAACCGLLGGALLAGVIDTAITASRRSQV
jgi:hypothetical protein